VLITLGIGVLLVGIAIGVAFASRQLFSMDQARTSVNQNLRAAMDIIGNDIRTTGERIDRRTLVNVNGLELIGGSEIVLRRNLFDETLPICVNNLGTNSTTITVARTTNSNGVNLTEHPQCRVLDGTGNNYPDNLDVWRAYRQAQGGSVPVFIFSPIAQDWNLYTGESQDGPRFNIQVSGARNYSYQVGANTGLFLVEERRYRLVGNTIELIINRNEANPQRLITDVESFNVRAIMTNGDVVTDSLSQANWDWTRIAAVEVSITGNASRNRDSRPRTLTSQFFPRNILREGTRGN
jgi:type IV pilus assembly protein PilW